MKSRIFLLPIVFLICLAGAYSQNIAVSGSRANYPYPWAGGMNECQFGRVDLDMDGTKDLVAFDRTGDRLMPFLAEDSGGLLNFQYAPEYSELFPVMEDWMILIDFDNDGREDIFTYSGFGGMIVYKNVSAAELKFDLIIFPFLTSFQGGGYTNILVTDVDYPAIDDIDGDGDLDILTFYGLGSFVEHHKNLSVEKYGHTDSLDYEKVEYCWGYFAESEESNVIYLDTCLGWKCNSGPVVKPPDRDYRHTGSTFRMVDLDDNGVMDLLLGDVDYPNLVALTNGGTADSAYMIDQDWNFPSGTRKINLYSMPAAIYTDVTGDGINDLVISPFDPNPVINQNFKSVWLYENAGSNNLPDFDFRKDNFLQSGMIDVGAGAYPVMVDYNGDGLDDLLIGNYGYYDTSYYDEFLTLYTDQVGTLNLFLNTGSSTNPRFQLESRDVAGLSEHEITGIVPAFSDLDGDGDLDMVAGKGDGALMHYENLAGPGNEMELSFRTNNYQDIDAGLYSAPCFYDLSGDGLDDLIVGSRGGNLSYYRNTGTAQNPVFTFITDSLGKVNVTDPNISLYGYSVPFFFDDNGKTGLLVGSEQGDIYYFTNIDGNLTGKFTESDSLFKHIEDDPVDPDRGFRTGAVATDIDNDGDLDVIAGNFCGGLEIFMNGSKPPVSMEVEEGTLLSKNVTIYPNPARDHLFVEIDKFNGQDNYIVRLLDNSGRQVIGAQNLNNGRFRLNTSTVEEGLYLVTITSGPEYYSQKVIILH
jgi:hypothetical protein